MTDLELRLDNQITTCEYLQARRSMGEKWLIYAMILRNLRWAERDLVNSIIETAWKNYYEP